MEELWKDTNIFYNVLCFLITENEKLFDRSDSNLYWRTVFHTFGILHHIYIGVFATTLDIEKSEIPDIRMLYTYRAGYLTGWNFPHCWAQWSVLQWESAIVHHVGLVRVGGFLMSSKTCYILTDMLFLMMFSFIVFQTVFLGTSFVHDVLEWLDKDKSSLGEKIKYWRDVMFCGLVVPCTLFVTTMFWCVYAIDRELVFPRVYDEVVPWWFNHCVHTNITIVVVVETLLQARRKPTDKKLELICYLIIAIAYAIVYYTIYFATNRWLYQVFGKMNWWQVCLYQLLIWSMMYIFYKIQFPINRIFHGKEVNVEHNEESQKSANNEDSSIKLNEGVKANDEKENNKVITDLKTPPFSTKSWSKKFRSIKNQFENSRL